MQKIVDLLKKLTASEELTKEIMEALGDYKKEIKEQSDAEFKERTAAARKVCIEAVDKEKKDIGRKVEIFLESRVNTINREAQRQAAIGETKAIKTLRELRTLLEGVTIDGTTEDHQAAVSELKKLRVICRKLQEQHNSAELKAQRANTIAMRLLKRQQLEVKAPIGKEIVESKESKESKPEAQPKTLQDLRKLKGVTQTTRQSIAETTIKQQKQVISEASDPEVQKIADGLDGTPAFVK